MTYQYLYEMLLFIALFFNNNAPVIEQPIVAQPIYSSTRLSVEGHLASISWCESRDIPTVISDNGLYFGLFQFDLLTWESVGGEGLPSDATVKEQHYRANLLYEQRGSAPWPTCRFN